MRGTLRQDGDPAGPRGRISRSVDRASTAAAPKATVKTHLLHVYAKLGVNDRAAAVAAAFSRGYLTPRD